MLRNLSLRILYLPAIAAAFGLITKTGDAVLYVYEPFNYTVGDSLGGTDPDGAGPTAGTPIGKSGTYDAGVGGGNYTWYARGTASNYQSPKDAVISSGNLSYAGLATSQGNSVSYGSGLPNVAFTPPDPEPANNLFNKSLYADSIALPVSVTSGALYASFIVRIKSDVEDATGAADRHSPVAFVNDATNAGNAGGALGTQSGTAQRAATFWMRRDPDDLELDVSNFSPGKSSGDGIGPGPGASGPSVGWQRSIGGTSIENNQFGNVTGQADVVFTDPNSYQNYFVVLKYEFDAATSTDDFDPPGMSIDAPQLDTVSLWMNPGSGTLGVANGETLASQNPAGNVGSYYAAVDAYGTGTNDMTDVNSFALIGHRQNTNNTFALDIDELRIGTTWQDVTPAAVGLLGDFNSDGKVDAGDYATWRKNDGTSNALANDNGLGTPIGPAHYNLWRANFGNPPGSGTAGGRRSAGVPEPASGTLLVFAATCMYILRRPIAI
jgi:hypothetical protein